MAYDKDFNWKAAEADVEDMGGDLDMLYTHNDKNRDSYLRELDLNPDRYKPKSGKNSSASSSGEDGCYIATCVYGSYDCPEVWTLRRFRDSILGRTAFGRAFIRAYYAISPTLVRWFGDTYWFRNFWESRLDRLVHQLKDRGIMDTPYRDQDWRRG